MKAARDLFGQKKKTAGRMTSDSQSAYFWLQTGFLWKIADLQRSTTGSEFSIFFLFTDKWPPTASGLPSTAGTTASCAFLRKGKLYIGHCGDSGIVLGRTNPKTGKWVAQPLTIEHKPESPEELQRIESCGGKVQEKQGTARVVWYRPKNPHQGPIRRNTRIEEIPFLAVARSLGDLWSYNYKTEKFVVSPEPDVSVLEIDPTSFKWVKLISNFTINWQFMFNF